MKKKKLTHKQLIKKSIANINKRSQAEKKWETTKQNIQDAARILDGRGLIHRRFSGK